MTRDYGRKPYISKDYEALFKDVPNAAMWEQQLSKHSEFEKPYMTDSYEEMQHIWPGFSGIMFDDLDFPWDDYIPKVGGPCDIVFVCQDNICYCPGATKETNFWCNPGHIINYRWFPNYAGLEIVELHDGKIKIKAPEGADLYGTLRFELQMKVKDDPCYGFTGWYPNYVGKCDDCCECEGISIGYTSASMQLNEEQILTASGGADECTYEWSANYGTITGTGVTVTYTASETSATCTADITLTVDGVECDTLEMNIQNPDYDDTDAYWGYTSSTCTEAFGCPCVAWFGYCTCNDTCGDSTPLLHGTNCGSCDSVCEDLDECTCDGGVLPEPFDHRSAEEKSQGCCPEALM